MSIYLTFIIKFSTSAPVEEAVNAVSWARQIACTDDSTRSEMVKQVLAWAKRMPAHKMNELITSEILSYVVHRVAGEKTDLDVAIWCLIWLCRFPVL